MSKETLLDLLQRARADQQALIDELTEAERDAIGTREHWSFKNTLSHIAAWVQHCADGLAAAQRGEQQQLSDDVDRINADIFDATHDRSWPQVLADIDRAYDELIARMHEMSDDDLTDPDRFAWRRGRSWARSIVGNIYWHLESHLALFRAGRGELARANQMQVAVTEALLALSDWRNVARYNLACFYALTGQKDKALVELRESLQINPDLIEWSKRDSDLDSLHDDPAFRALYQS